MVLRKAHLSEVPVIWEIIQQAIVQRKNDGSDQWQNGYPNEQTIIDDIEKGYGYVLIDKDEVIAYAAIIFDGEPAYNQITGKWLTTKEDYAVLHRVATSNQVKGKGIATRLFKMVEDLSMDQSVFSIKVDTNFDNLPMLRIMEKLEYTLCGEIVFQGNARKAFEKVLVR